VLLDGRRIAELRNLGTDGTFSVEKPENNNEPLAERKEFKNQYLGKTSNQQQSVKAAGEILSCHP
jgi:hypothetical protein